MLLAVLVSLCSGHTLGLLDQIRHLARKVFPHIQIVQSKPPCSDCTAWLTAVAMFLKLKEPHPIRIVGDGGRDWGW